jgi:ankyrin repeat protein
LNDGADDDLQALLFALVQTESADRDTIEFLIQNGVNLDAVGPDGMAALHLAVASGAVQLAKRLITNGADVNVIDTTGNTPLSIAQTLPDPSRAAIMTELLQQFGATK